MIIDIDMNSDDFEQLEADIVAKYAGIRQKATLKKVASIDKQIQKGEESL